MQTVGFHDVLPICIFPTFWGAEEIKNWKWNISVNIYTWRNPKRLLRWRLSLLKRWKKLGEFIPHIFGARYHWPPYFPMNFDEFWDFWGIFGLLTQIMRPITSEGLVHLCHFDIIKYPPRQQLFWDIKTVGLY